MQQRNHQRQSMKLQMKSRKESETFYFMFHYLAFFLATKGIFFVEQL